MRWHVKEYEWEEDHTQDPSLWHKWYAWYPVWLPGSRDLVLFEEVERRQVRANEDCDGCKELGAEIPGDIHRPHLLWEYKEVGV